MSTSFDEFIAGLHAEAAAEGRDAVDELDAFRLRFSLSHQFAALRKKRGLTQSQLAALSGVHPSEISRIECGQADPTVSVLGAVARALRADVRLVARDG
jgi:DNA-binding XRE family transcriptional regulator